MDSAARYVFTLEYVPDIDDAKRFFIEVMHLEVEREAPTFVQFKDINGVGFAISTEEPIGGSVGQEIYWSVESADGAYSELSAHTKVIVPLETKPFGTVFGIEDPAGQPHFFVEFARTRPSQPAS